MQKLGLETPSWLVDYWIFLEHMFLFALIRYYSSPTKMDKKIHAEGFNTKWQKTILLVLAIAMHNIPEGLAVDKAFGAIVSKNQLNNLNGDSFHFRF